MSWHNFSKGQTVRREDVVSVCEKHIQSGKVKKPEYARSFFLEKIKNCRYETIVYTPQQKTGWGSSPINPNNWRTSDSKPIWNKKRRPKGGITDKIKIDKAKGIKMTSDKDTFDFDEWVNSESIQNLIRKYVKARNDNDRENWNESYKWDILPRVHKDVFSETLSASNIIEKVRMLNKYNPKKGTLAHWTNLDSLKKIAEQEPDTVARVINQLLQGKSSPLHERIDGTIEACRRIREGAKLGAPLFGYILATYDCNEYPLFKGGTYDRLKTLVNKKAEWKSLSVGMKYQKFQEMCIKMGEHFKKHGLLENRRVGEIEVRAGLTALDGQDFFYCIDHYLQGTDPPPPPPPPPPPNRPFTKEMILREVFMEESTFDQIVELLKESTKKQIILQGPPGTGKTFIAKKIAQYITQEEKRIEIIQFHPSISYEDFIEGYRPTEKKGFELQEGIFKAFCKKAEDDREKNHVLIIDEINRGNLSKIFGELLYLLEYRDEKVKLGYSLKTFSIPPNLSIIGTMNTADRSLAIMDYALRRRFYFVDLKCETKRLGKWLEEKGCKIKTDELVDKIEKMNKRIGDEMHSEDFAIGHSYFMKEHLGDDELEKVINFEIRPLLDEYFFDKREKVEQILGDLK